MAGGSGAAATNRRSQVEAPEPVEAQRMTTRSQELIDKLEATGGKDRSNMWILTIMGVMVVGGGLIFWISYSISKGKEQAARAALESSAAAVAAVEQEFARNPDNYEVLLRLLDEKEPATKEFQKDRAKMANYRSDVISRKETAEGRKRALDLLKQCQDEVKVKEKIPSVKLKLPDLERAVSSMDEEFKKAVIQLKSDVIVNGLKAAVETAEEEATQAGADLTAAIAAYDKAMYTFRDFFKNFTPKPGDISLTLYQQLIAKSDEMVNKLITPEYEAQTAPRDLLAPKERTSGVWGASKGIKWDFSGRELIAEGVPIEKGKIIGVLSIDGWTTPWYDLVLDIDFEILNGGFDLFLRYRPDGYKYYSATFKAGEGGYEGNKTYHLTIRVKGSAVSMEQPDQQPTGDAFHASVSRTGGIGFAVPLGSKIAIKSAILKVLRPRGGIKSG